MDNELKKIIDDIENNRIKGLDSLFSRASEKIASIRWIMIHPYFQRKGYGKDLMKYIIKYSIDKKKDTITISTSQYAKSFFEKHGAVMISFEKNGWDEGLHKVNMKIDLNS